MSRNLSDENADLGSIASVGNRESQEDAETKYMAQRTPPHPANMRQTVVSINKTNMFLRTKVGMTNSAESEPPLLHFRPQFKNLQMSKKESAERVNSHGTEAGS